MKKNIYYCLVAIFFVQFSFGQSVLDYSQFTKLWSEDFNGTIEDVEKHWRVGRYEWGYSNDKREYSTSPMSRQLITFLSSKDNMKVSNGEMHMKMSMLPEYEYLPVCKDIKDSSTCKNYRVKYTYSTMETTFGELFGKSKCDDINDNGGWLYGLFEVRCKIPKNPLMFSTFWMLPADASLPEIDIFEVSHMCQKATLFSGCKSKDFTNGVAQKPPGKNHKAKFHHNFFRVDPETFYDQYHTWSMLWMPDKIIFYLDGNEYRTFEGSLNTDDRPLSCQWRRMQIILTAKPSNMAHWPVYYKQFDPNTEFTIDWVRVSKPKNKNYDFNLKPALKAFEKKDIQEFSTNDKQVDLTNVLNKNIRKKIKNVSFNKQNSNEIIYTTKSRKLKQLVNTNGKWESSMLIKNQAKANLFSVTNNFVFYESGKHIWPFWFRDKKLWVYDKKKEESLKFSNKITTKKKDGFVASESGKKVFSINDKNQIRYNEYDVVSATWKEDLELIPGLKDAYKNLVVTENGNRLFYTTKIGKIITVYKEKNQWKKEIVSDIYKIDIDGSNVLAYDEKNKRLFFTTSFPNPTVIKSKTTGVLSYFEKDNDSWKYRSIHVNKNEKNYNKNQGRVKKDFSISENNEVTYIAKDNKEYILKTPKKVDLLKFEHDSYINGLK